MDHDPKEAAEGAELGSEGCQGPRSMPLPVLTVKTCVGSLLFDGHTSLTHETSALSM